MHENISESELELSNPTAHAIKRNLSEIASARESPTIRYGGIAPRVVH